MTDKPVRVRFAPSPTGSLHIGGARTALFNWLFARHHGGKFILRIEDTDQTRFVEGSIEEIMNGLRWLGIIWDEGPDIGGEFGPYVQSQRLELYQKWAHHLVEQGKAYRCYATAEELKRAREIAQKSKGGKIAGYERIYRFISDEERAKVEAERPSYVIRLAMPLEGQVVVHDEIRGTIRFPAEELSDLVLLKSDGFPTYHLAMAVDDHFMEISHVMRSDEWLPSLPMHTYLYTALEWDAPKFVHLPLMVFNGKKISKRNPPVLQDGRPIPLMMKDYIESGFQPEAVVNWLTNIGWSFGEDIEIYTTPAAIERFGLERINIAPTEMPFSKLEYLNGHYIRSMSLDEFIDAIRPLLVAEYGEIDEDKLRIIAPAMQERANPLHIAVPLVDFIFGKNFQAPSVDILIPKKMDAATTKTILERVHDVLRDIDDFSPAAQEEAVRALGEEMDVKAGQLFNPIRWATTNQQIAPPLFDSTAALGREITLERLKMAAALL